MKEGKSGFKVCLFRLVVCPSPRLHDGCCSTFNVKRCPDQLPLPDAIARFPMAKSKEMQFNKLPTSSGNTSDVVKGSPTF